MTNFENSPSEATNNVSASPLAYATYAIILRMAYSEGLPLLIGHHPDNTDGIALIAGAVVRNGYDLFNSFFFNEPVYLVVQIF